MKKASVLLLAGIMSIIFTTKAYAGEKVEAAPKGSSFKPYMSYEAITNKNSMQYRLQQFAETDIWGLRKLNGRYMIAMGSHYSTKIGTEIDIILDDGRVLNCVLGDSKADRHTDSTNRVGAHNDTIEFIVDGNELHEVIKYHGDVSRIIGFAGDVKVVVVHESETYIPTDPLLA